MKNCEMVINFQSAKINTSKNPKGADRSRKRESDTKLFITYASRTLFINSQSGFRFRILQAKKPLSLLKHRYWK